MRKSLPALLFFLFLAPPAWGEGISVVDPWVRQNSPGTSVTAAYMVIENPGTDDELLEISCACAREASLHAVETRKSSDSMVMKEVSSIAVPSGTSVVLSPGGLHVMLMGLSGDMDKNVILELGFRSGARIEVSAPVLSPAAAQKRSRR